MKFVRRSFERIGFLTLAKAEPQSSETVPTKEEQVAGEAIPQEILKESGYAAIVSEFEKALPTRGTPSLAREEVLEHGVRLWRKAKRRAQSRKNPDADDRPLYWARLRSTAFVRGFTPSYPLSAVDRQGLVDTLEAASRGRTSIAFEKTPEGVRKVLVSGFDPFGFQSGGERSQDNPSGAAVLALDGKTIDSTSGKAQGKVEGVIFPVRFADFDRGVVETTFRPYLTNPKRKVDMIMTISLAGKELPAEEAGKSKRYELERWAGRNRSSPSVDNEGVRGDDVYEGGVQEGKRLPKGEQFLESTLPREKMSHRKETAEESGKSESGGMAIEGSGGGYLSNEVFYRTRLLAGAGDEAVPVGHLHVPRQKAPGSPSEERTQRTVRDAIVKWVRRLIANALSWMGKKPKPKPKEEKAGDEYPDWL
jgi:pyrrolidone-carboxylate peptidase